VIGVSLVRVQPGTGYRTHPRGAVQGLDTATRVEVLPRLTGIEHTVAVGISDVDPGFAGVHHAIFLVRHVFMI